MTYTVPTPAAGRYYKLEYDCAKGSSNGFIQISKVEYYYNTSTSTAPVAPVFSPASGAVGSTASPLTVTMSSTTSGATIRYTTTGTAPTATTGTVGTSVTLSSAGTHTLKAVAVKNGEASAVTTGTYTIITPPAAPTFTPSAATTGTSVTVTMSSTTGGATIHYTTDGSTPTTASASGTSVTLSTPGTYTVRAIAAVSGIAGQVSVSPTYTVLPQAPTFTPASGTSGTTASPLTVTMSSTGGGTIYYTTDGSTPTTASASGTSVTLATAGTHTVKAIAVVNGLTSAMSQATYTITKSSVPSGSYVLVTDASTLSAGDRLVIANAATAGSAYAMSTTANTNNISGTAATISSTGGLLYIIPGDAVEIYELCGTTDAWSFMATVSASNKSKYLNASGGSSSNYLKYVASIGDNSKATVSISGGVATVIFPPDRGYLRYNPNSNNPIFSCYASSSTVGNQVSLYRLAAEEEPEPELTVVEGIASFQEVEAETTVRLYLPDGDQVRVLHVEAGAGGTTDAYLRDGDGNTLLMKGVSPNVSMTAGQHLAGWINGQYAADSNGVPQFIPDNGLTNTAYLVIAAPVTEAAVTPTEIDADAIGDHLGDWVSVSDVRVGETAVTLTDSFGVGYNAPHTGALVDVSAIAAASGTLYPVDEGSVPVLTYVLDSKQSYTSPPADLDNAAVRVERRLTAGQWAPLTLPFDYDEFDGQVQQYTGLGNGDRIEYASGKWMDAGVMYFSPADGIRAGVPYLVKPNVDYTTFTATGVTLHAGQAQSVARTTQGQVSGNAPARAIGQSDEYAFTGTYSPATLDASKTYRYFDSSGNILWADSGASIDGSTAYFTVPATQGLHVSLYGEDSVITGIGDLPADTGQTHSGIYNIVGERMPDDWQQLPPGFYIVDGVKTIKR